MSTKIFCDFSNLACMCFYPAQQACEKDSSYVLLDVFKKNIDLKLRAISNCLLSNGLLDAEFIFVKDENSVRKILLYPQYKEAHKTSKVPIRDGVDYVKDKGYGKFCSSPGNEADDAIATLTREYGGGVVVSMDKDLWQLIDHRNVSVFSPLLKTFISRENIDKVFRVQDPSHIALYKALWGDSGDGVPNAVPRMQKQLLPVIRASDGSMDGFSSSLLMAWDSLTPTCKQLYHANQEQVFINYQLVHLDQFCEIVWD